ncbi:reverse transcriptase domain-containing protein [Tanacetum coccineum]
MVSNQIRPPGFPPIQNNQNHFNQNQGNNFNQNRGTNFNQNHGNNFNQGQVYQPPTNQPPVYQAPTLQMYGVSKTDFENYVKANDAVLRNMQNQGQGLQNQMTNLTEMLSKFISSNTASSSSSGTLPSQTVTNPREHVNAIHHMIVVKTVKALRLLLFLVRCFYYSLRNPRTNPEDVKWTKIRKTVQEPNSPEPNSYQPKLPYPERMKVREKDTPSAQQSRFMKLFKQLRLEIGLKDALIKMPKFNKWLSTLLRNKEKLEEIAITTVNAESDSGASINLLPHSIYKQLGLGALKPTRMTLELANRSVTHPMGIAEDVVVRVDDEPFSGSTTNHSDALPPSSSPVKTSDNPEEFDDELTLLKKGVHEENFQVYSNPLFEFDDNFNSSNVNPLFNKKDEDDENENSNVSNSDELVFLNTSLTDKVECFDPEDNIDEIDVFLAMEVSSNFEEGYYNSEGDVIFLENLLSDDTTHNLAPEVIFDHEPKQNESIHNTSITFSPRSDPLHHEFAGELLTLPSRIDKNHVDYLVLWTIACEISTSRSPENVHANSSSIIESRIPVEDSDPVQEEIDIFLVSGDLIPPGVENDNSEDEDNSTFLPKNESSILEPSSPHPPPEPTQKFA